MAESRAACYRTEAICVYETSCYLGVLVSWDLIRQVSMLYGGNTSQPPTTRFSSILISKSPSESSKSPSPSDARNRNYSSLHQPTAAYITAPFENPEEEA